MKTPQNIEGPNWHVYTGPGAEDARKEGFIHITARSNAGPLIANVSDGKCPFLQRAGIKELPAEAHANLIAAAPELLAALQNCLSAFETHYVAGEKLSDHYTGRIERARAAIAKAKGEEVPV